MMKEFEEYVEKHGNSIVKGKLACLQMNLGYVCNLRCGHCHVEAGPDRQEQMNAAVMNDCISFIERAGIKTVDITGGAPEMNPHLRYLIASLRKLKSVEAILLRSNLAILEEKPYLDLPKFFAENSVEIIASLPCYLEENVTAQRGKGVYHKNIRILQKLNQLGYGGEHLKLHLVYNPGGNFLPAPQQELESAYKENLKQRFAIAFNSLYTITNMPIGRFKDSLEKQGLLSGYMKLLAANFNVQNLTKVMCRNLINVDWQGKVYDCDFNHVLKLPAEGHTYIGDCNAEELAGKPVAIGNHCFACVAGAGSSCQGTLHDKAV